LFELVKLILYMMQNDDIKSVVLSYLVMQIKSHKFGKNKLLCHSNSINLKLYKPT